MSKIKKDRPPETKSDLWNHMADIHGLTLLGSEINDILELARQEIELPSDEEVLEEAHRQIHHEKWNEVALFFSGAKWALNKVRNPYPKTIQFLRDDEDGMMKPTGDEIHPKYNEAMKIFFDKLSKDTEGMNPMEYLNYVNNLMK